MAASRPSIDLGGEWQFIRDRERRREPPDLGGGVPIRVPACWEAEVADASGIVSAWYTRTFDVPGDWTVDGSSDALLRFDGVMYHASVWLNGIPIGEHEGGYTSFELSAGQALRPGENAIAVLVTNPMNAIGDYPAFSADALRSVDPGVPGMPIAELPHGKQTWYSSTSGIWRPVRLERVGRAFFRSVRVRTDLGRGEARVRWSIEASHDPTLAATAGGPAEVRLTVVEPDGRAVAALGAEWAAGEATVAIPDAHPWDVEDPFLYVLEAELVAADGAVLDRWTTRFGVRQIAARDGQILLNGRPILLRAALDQAVYADTIGGPPSRAALEDQARLAKEMGLNCLRCHLKSPDPGYLDVADEAGLLVWAELPNWITFSEAAAARGRATLERLVEELGDHPSLVAWTIVNEDWGTDLRTEPTHRQWLLEMVDHVRTLDPTRLVIDNSACEAEPRPNFHLSTDLADFHLYRAMPDHAPSWRAEIAGIAGRPAWLWSPNGDAVIRGDEPVVLSEFGNWGLPRVQASIASGREPWWFATGHGPARPEGMASRFEALELDRIWPDLDSLATATQWHEFEALQYEIGQLRRHGSIAGYVITELTDAYWEANGLLELDRRPKAFHDRLAELNGPDAIVVDLADRDLWGGETCTVDVALSSFDPRETESGEIEWTFRLEGGPPRSGRLAVRAWPRFGASSVGAIAIDVPDVEPATGAELVLVAHDAAGIERARSTVRFAVVPSSARRTRAPLRVAVSDPGERWGIEQRMRELGHALVSGDVADLLVASRASAEILEFVADGGAALVLVREPDALFDGGEVNLPLAVQARAGTLPDRSDRPWQGDWIGTFSWIRPGALDGLPARNPLDFAYRQVAPEHVLVARDGKPPRDAIAGMFAGWLHDPAALAWSTGLGRGRLTLTTFHLSPEQGPMATLLLEGLVQAAAGAPSSPAGRDVGAVHVARP